MDHTVDISLQGTHASTPDQDCPEQNEALLRCESYSIPNTMASSNQPATFLQPSDVQFRGYSWRLNDLDDRINKDYKWLRCWFFVQVTFFLVNAINKIVCGFPIVYEIVISLFQLTMYGTGIRAMMRKDLPMSQCCYIMMSLFTVFLALAIIISAVSYFEESSNGPTADEKHPFMSSFNSLPVPLITVFLSFFVIFLTTNLLPLRRVRDILKERSICLQNASTVNSSINSEL